MNWLLNHVHSNPCVYDFVQINHFFTYYFILLKSHVIQMIYNHIILNCKCDYDLPLLLIWMKIRMKNVFISSTINDVQLYKQNLIVITTNNVVHM
jgi:hypothetical protein